MVEDTRVFLEHHTSAASELTYFPILRLWFERSDGRPVNIVRQFKKIKNNNNNNKFNKQKNMQKN